MIDKRLDEIRTRYEAAMPGWAAVVESILHVQEDISYLLAKIEHLQESTRWILVEERLPTKKDANQYGEVLSWRLGRCMRVNYRNVSPATASHWQRIVGPEDN